MASNNSWNNQIAAANSAITLNSGTNAVSVSTDASNTTVNVATGGAVKTATFGSTNSTSTTTVQSGSGALNVTSTNGALTINSGTGALSISNDASATTVGLGTGAGAKTVTVGSTTTTSSLALKYGTADFTLASATGTVMSALDTGEITKPLQPAFHAYLGTTDNNATGDATVFALGSGNALTEVYDQGGDFVTTGTFTAPVSGRYYFGCAILTQNTLSGHTTWEIRINTSNQIFEPVYQNGFANNAASAFLGSNGCVVANMDASDTCDFQIVISGSTKTVEVVGSASFTYVYGGLLV